MFQIEKETFYRFRQLKICPIFCSEESLGLLRSKLDWGGFLLVVTMEIVNKMRKILNTVFLFFSVLYVMFVFQKWKQQKVLNLKYDLSSVSVNSISNREHRNQKEVQGFEIKDDHIVPPRSLGSSQSYNNLKNISIPGTERIWPFGVIPVYFSPEINEAQKAIFWQAANEWNSIESAIRIIERTNESYFLTVTNGGLESGCRATVGYFWGEGELDRPNMNLESSPTGECMRKGVILHELGHVIGFEHEHQRSDRSNYIDLTEKGLAYSWAHQTIQMPIETPYDPTSAMHYCFSSKEDFFRIRPNAKFDPTIDLNNICYKQADYRLSVWDKYASQVLYSKIMGLPRPTRPTKPEHVVQQKNHME